MKRCSVCGEKAGLLSHKIYEGVICKECLKRIPDCISLKHTDEHFLRRMVNRSKEREKAFEPTSFYGGLYLDSVHSMLCYSKNGIGGYPLSFGDIYTVKELKELGLYITNVRDVGKSYVDIRCDVKLKVTTEDIHGEYLVIRNRQCPVFKNAEGKYDCHDPAELVMIQNMLTQMIEDVSYGYNRRIAKMRLLQEMAEQELKPKEQQDKEWARGVLFLENKDCSIEEIKRQYRELCRFYHPDIHPELSEEYMKKLNKAYAILTS